MLSWKQIPLSLTEQHRIFLLWIYIEKFLRRAPDSNFLHLHAAFRKIWPNNRLTPLFRVSNILWKILDQPLVEHKITTL